MVYVLLGEGFEEIEAVAPYDILNRGGVPVRYAGIGGRVISGAHGIKITADCDISEIKPGKGDYIVIPGAWAV
jgi:4-methyl-5(b-hydroxyethyl)-thiazole monophosphate biosynthesis